MSRDRCALAHLLSEGGMSRKDITSLLWTLRAGEGNCPHPDSIAYHILKLVAKRVDGQRQATLEWCHRNVAHAAEEGCSEWPDHPQGVDPPPQA